MNKVDDKYKLFDLIFQGICDKAKHLKESAKVFEERISDNFPRVRIKL